MKLMEFVINMAVNGNAASKDLKAVTSGADAAGKSMSDLEKRAEAAGARIGNGMRSAAVGIASAGAAAAAAVGGMYKLTAGVADSLDDLDDFAQLNKIGVEALQEFGYAAMKTGSSQEQFNSSVTGLNKVLGQAQNGIGKGAKMFEKYGVSVKNADGSNASVTQTLYNLSDAMQGLTQQQAIAMAASFGIDPTLVPMLLEGRDAINAYRDSAQKLGITNQEMVDKTKEFKSTTEDMGMTFSYLKNVIGSELAPVFSSLMVQFLESQGGAAGLKVKAQELTQKFAAALPQIAKVASAFGTIVIAIAGLLDSLQQLLGGWDNLTISLIVFKTISSAGLFLPLLNSIPIVMKAIGGLTSFVIASFLRMGAVMLANPMVLIAAAIIAAGYLIWDNWDKVIGFLKDAWAAFANHFIRQANGIIGIINKLTGLNVGTFDMVQGAPPSTANPATSATGGNTFTNNVTVNANTRAAVDRAVEPSFGRQTRSAGLSGVMA